MKDKWYGDNRDLVKWGVLLQLARRYSASRIVQVAYYRPEIIEIDGCKYPIPDAVTRHFRRDLMDIDRLNSSGVQIEVFNLQLLDCNDYKRDVLTLVKRISFGPPCIIFLDPDTGLEPQDSRPNLKHVRESDLEKIWKEMRGNDVLVFYQHAPRVAKDTTWIEAKHWQFESALGLSNGDAKVARGEVAPDVVFFFARKPLPDSVQKK